MIVLINLITFALLGVARNITIIAFLLAVFTEARKNVNADFISHKSFKTGVCNLQHVM